MRRALPFDLRAAFVGVMLLLGGGALFAMWLLSSRTAQVQITPIYLRSTAGVFAWLRFPEPRPKMPFLATVAAQVEGQLYLWKDNRWERGGGTLSFGWRAEGAEARVHVPDAKWRYEMQIIRRDAVRVGTFSFTLPARTNLFVSQELPPARDATNDHSVQWPPPGLKTK